MSKIEKAMTSMSVPKGTNLRSNQVSRAVAQSFSSSESPFQSTVLPEFTNRPAFLITDRSIDPYSGNPRVVKHTIDPAVDMFRKAGYEHFLGDEQHLQNQMALQRTGQLPHQQMQGPPTQPGQPVPPTQNPGFAQSGARGAAMGSQAANMIMDPSAGAFVSGIANIPGAIGNKLLQGGDVATQKIGQAIQGGQNDPASSKPLPPSLRPNPPGSEGASGMGGSAAGRSNDAGTPFDPGISYPDVEGATPKPTPNPAHERFKDASALGDKYRQAVKNDTARDVRESQGKQTSADVFGSSNKDLATPADTAGSSILSDGHPGGTSGGAFSQQFAGDDDGSKTSGFQIHGPSEQSTMGNLDHQADLSRKWSTPDATPKADNYKQATTQPTSPGGAGKPGDIPQAPPSPNPTNATPKTGAGNYSAEIGTKTPSQTGAAGPTTKPAAVPQVLGGLPSTGNVELGGTQANPSSETKPINVPLNPRTGRQSLGPTGKPIQSLSPPAAAQSQTPPPAASKPAQLPRSPSLEQQASSALASAQNIQSNQPSTASGVADRGNQINQLHQQVSQMVGSQGSTNTPSTNTPAAPAAQPATSATAPPPAASKPATLPKPPTVKGLTMGFQIYVESINKSSGGPGSRGGNVVGTTASGSPVYEKKDGDSLRGPDKTIEQTIADSEARQRNKAKQKEDKARKRSDSMQNAKSKVKNLWGKFVDSMKDSDVEKAKPKGIKSPRGAVHEYAHRFKHGEPLSNTGKPPVSREQAIAIGLSKEERGGNVHVGPAEHSKVEGMGKNERAKWRSNVRKKAKTSKGFGVVVKGEFTLDGDVELHHDADRPGKGRKSPLKIDGKEKPGDTTIEHDDTSKAVGLGDYGAGLLLAMDLYADSIVKGGGAWETGPRGGKRQKQDDGTWKYESIGTKERGHSSTHPSESPDTAGYLVDQAHSMKKMMNQNAEKIKGQESKVEHRGGERAASKLWNEGHGKKPEGAMSKIGSWMGGGKSKTRRDAPYKDKHGGKSWQHHEAESEVHGHKADSHKKEGNHFMAGYHGKMKEHHAGHADSKRPKTTKEAMDSMSVGESMKHNSRLRHSENPAKDLKHVQDAQREKHKNDEKEKNDDAHSNSSEGRKERAEKWKKFKADRLGSGGPGGNMGSVDVGGMMSAAELDFGSLAESAVEGLIGSIFKSENVDKSFIFGGPGIGSFDSPDRCCSVFIGSPYYARALENRSAQLAAQADMTDLPYRYEPFGADKKKNDKDDKKRNACLDKMDNLRAERTRIESDFVAWKAKKTRRDDSTQKSLGFGIVVR